MFGVVARYLLAELDNRLRRASFYGKRTPGAAVWISWWTFRLRVGRAYAHDVGQPARLREGVEHDGHEERHGQGQKGAGATEQPSPENERQKHDCRGDAESPAHHHRRENILGQDVDDRNPRDDEQGPAHTELGQQHRRRAAASTSPT